jgi:DNA sulfur modification protein DndC
MALNKNTLQAWLSDKKAEIQREYLKDAAPWMIGFSGGKDSSVVAQLIWMAIADLPEELRSKMVYITSVDTMVENPVVVHNLKKTHQTINAQASEHNMPFEAKMLYPEVNQRFWSNFIGRGYVTPRLNLRWCTDRLKIRPANLFSEHLINTHQKAVMAIGVRIDESANRAKSIRKHSTEGSSMHPSPTQPGLMIYSPIVDLSSDDVWYFIFENRHPFSMETNAINSELFAMYMDAMDSGECPMVLDTSTPSCGKSRFGCWTCTLVSEDKSMNAMVGTAEHAWMKPLRDLRDEMDHHGKDIEGRDKRELDVQSREIFKSKGHYFVYQGKLVHGAYTQKTRVMYLLKLLSAQKKIREDAPDKYKSIEIISLAELEEIRRIWVEEKMEIEDYVPQIYRMVYEEKYPGDEDKYSHYAGINYPLRSECIRTADYEFHRNVAVTLRRHEIKKSTANELFGGVEFELETLKQIAELQIRYQFLNSDDALDFMIAEDKIAIEKNIDEQKINIIETANQLSLGL